MDRSVLEFVDMLIKRADAFDDAYYAIGGNINSGVNSVLNATPPVARPALSSALGSVRKAIDAPADIVGHGTESFGRMFTPHLPHGLHTPHPFGYALHLVNPTATVTDAIRRMPRDFVTRPDGRPSPLDYTLEAAKK